VKTVILGAGGQLATDLERVMADWELVTLRHTDLDVCDFDEVRGALREIQPEAVINTAAFHRVDDCEDQVERAFEVNTFAVRNLAQVCAELECRLVHISTDYVFGGNSARQTPYTEDDPPNPVNVYGVSKLAGEYFVRNLCPRHLVIRTSGLYGLAGSSGKGGNFVETMLRLAKQGKPIYVVDDQVLSPTFTLNLAQAMCGILEANKPGVFHLTSEGECSWYVFAEAIFEIEGASVDLNPISSAEYGARALRPRYSSLATRRGGTSPRQALPHWRQALQSYLSSRSIYNGEP